MHLDGNDATGVLLGFNKALYEDGCDTRSGS